MTVALIRRIGDLFPKFLADAFILLCPFSATRTVAACLLQAFPDHRYHFLILIEPNCHSITPLSHHYMVF